MKLLLDIYTFTFIFGTMTFEALIDWKITRQSLRGIPHSIVQDGKLNTNLLNLFTFSKTVQFFKNNHLI